MHWEWRGMVVNSLHEQATFSKNHIFTCGERKNQEMCAQSIPHPCVSLPQAARASWAFSLTFSCILLIFSCWETYFCIIE